MSSLPPLCGLVLAGGESRRMGRDKATLSYCGATQLEKTYALVARHCERAFVSVRADHASEPSRARFPQIVDGSAGQGPIAGIAAAQAAHPGAAWLVVACDLPFLSDATLGYLVAHRGEHAVTAFRSSHDGLPEPLCAIYEPGTREALLESIAQGRNCPRKFVIASGAPLLEQPEPSALDNVNTPEEFAKAAARLAPRKVHIQYFAALREQAGVGSETLATTAADAAALYEQVRADRGLTLPRSMLKVAVNEEFSPWHRPLEDGDRVVFIPPVAGG